MPSIRTQRVVRALPFEGTSARHRSGLVPRVPHSGKPTLLPPRVSAYRQQTRTDRLPSRTRHATNAQQANSPFTRSIVAIWLPDAHNAFLRSVETVGIVSRPTVEEPLENLLNEMPKVQGARGKAQRSISQAQGQRAIGIFRMQAHRPACLRLGLILLLPRAPQSGSSRADSRSHVSRS